MTSWQPYWCSKIIKRMATMLEYQKNPAGVELLSCVTTIYYSSTFICMASGHVSAYREYEDLSRHWCVNVIVSFIVY